MLDIEGMVGFWLVLLIALLSENTSKRSKVLGLDEAEVAG